MNIEFIVGTMGAGKSAKVIELAKKFPRNLLYKVSPSEKNESKIESRNGQKADCRVINVKQDALSIITDLVYNIHMKENVRLLIIDEAQFLKAEQIQAIESVAMIYDIDIIFSGLMYDFKAEIFEGSKIILQIHDKLTAIPSFCQEDGCLNRALYNGRITQTDKLVVEDKSVYKALCPQHYAELISEKF